MPPTETWCFPNSIASYRSAAAAAASTALAQVLKNLRNRLQFISFHSSALPYLSADGDYSKILCAVSGRPNCWDAMRVKDSFQDSKWIVKELLYVSEVVRSTHMAGVMTKRLQPDDEFSNLFEQAAETELNLAAFVGFKVGKTHLKPPPSPFPNERPVLSRLLPFNIPPHDLARIHKFDYFNNYFLCEGFISFLIIHDIRSIVHIQFKTLSNTQTREFNWLQRKNCSKWRASKESNV